MSGIVDELSRLEGMRAQGAISEHEFALLKTDVLRRATSPEVVSAPLLPSQPPPPSGPRLPPPRATGSPPAAPGAPAMTIGVADVAARRTRRRWFGRRAR